MLIDEGSAYVYVEGKRQVGVYCKVYGEQRNQSRFLKDGYTDIRGGFRYIPQNSEEIERYAVLSVTEKGGVVKIVDRPGKTGSL